MHGRTKRNDSENGLRRALEAGGRHAHDLVWHVHEAVDHLHAVHTHLHIYKGTQLGQPLGREAARVNQAGIRPQLAHDLVDLRRRKGPRKSSRHLLLELLIRRIRRSPGRVQRSLPEQLQSVVGIEPDHLRVGRLQQGRQRPHERWLEAQQRQGAAGAVLQAHVLQRQVLVRWRPLQGRRGLSVHLGIRDHRSQPHGPQTRYGRRLVVVLPPHRLQVWPGHLLLRQPLHRLEDHAGGRLQKLPDLGLPGQEMQHKARLGRVGSLVHRLVQEREERVLVRRVASEQIAQERERHNALAREEKAGRVKKGLQRGHQTTSSTTLG
eukprot:scaffold576_cov260-Pinguiococcus_pyrenoidosus.AAC.64